MEIIENKVKENHQHFVGNYLQTEDAQSFLVSLKCDGRVKTFSDIQSLKISSEDSGECTSPK